MLEPLSTSLIRCDLTVLWGGKGRVKAGVWWRDSGGLLEPFQPLGWVEISKNHTLVRPPFFHITVIMNVNISTYIYIYIIYILYLWDHRYRSSRDSDFNNSSLTDSQIFYWLTVGDPYCWEGIWELPLNLKWEKTSQKIPRSWSDLFWHGAYDRFGIPIDIYIYIYTYKKDTCKNQDIQDHKSLGNIYPIQLTSMGQHGVDNWIFNSVNGVPSFKSITASCVVPEVPETSEDHLRPHSSLSRAGDQILF